MTSSRFIVELPQHDSDREGTLTDIRISIDRLKHVSNEVFRNIEDRISSEIARLQELEKRVGIVQQKIAMVASQPSKACTLSIPSKLPPSQHRSLHDSLFASFPIQKIADTDGDEHRFRNRKNADQDEDPRVPTEALLDLDKRMLSAVSVKVREASDQARILSSEVQNAVATWLPLLASRMPSDDSDDEDMGPAPLSLKTIRSHEQEKGFGTLEIPGMGQDHVRTVEYRPKTKEAHQLGLPTSLADLLPDIAEPTTFLSRANNATVATMPSLLPTIGEEKFRISPPKTVDGESNHHRASSLLLEKSTVESLASSSRPPAHPTLAAEESDLAHGHSVVGSTPPQMEAASLSKVVSSSSPKMDPLKGLPVPAVDQSRRDLLASIREAKLLTATSARAAKTNAAAPAKTVKRPVTLADEMREKLARRQKALSGERDDEEQLAERRRKGLGDTWDDKSSDSGSISPYSVHMLAPKGRTGGGTKRPREPSGSAAASKTDMPFAGLDALLNRELAAKSSIVPKPPPKPASSAGDWDDD